MKKHPHSAPASKGMSGSQKRAVPPLSKQSGYSKENREKTLEQDDDQEGDSRWSRYGLIKKLGILFAAILTITLLWFSGLEVMHARALVATANAVLDLGGRETRLAVEAQDNVYLFKVRTIIEGRSGSYPQTFGPLLLPTVMVIAWQVFMAFFLNRKKWLLSSLLNLACFFAVQVVFLLLLSAYYTSATARYIYDMMLDSFYIIALLIILLDNIRHPVFLSHLKLK